MEGEVVTKEDTNTLPPGFRFHPTDEELITCYLINKISDSNFTGRAITDVDLNKCEPWDLPGKAKMGEKEWYFFSLRDRKYPTGVRTNRATNTGYWKTTGKDKEIFSGTSSELVGMKKTLVFYRGRAPRGEKTNWVMHEYRLHSKSPFRPAKDEWVVCRVFQKSAGGKKYPSSTTHTRSVVMNPYNLEISPTSGMPLMYPMDDAYHQVQFTGKTYAELAELSHLFRASSSSSTPNTVNMPLLHPQHNYSIPSQAAAGCFTISGLNLNLGGVGVGSTSSTAPLPPPPSVMASINQSQQDHMAVPIMMNDPVYDGANGSRFIAMDNCSDLDNYWPPY